MALILPSLLPLLNSIVFPSLQTSDKFADNMVDKIKEKELDSTEAALVAALREESPGRSQWLAEQRPVIADGDFERSLLPRYTAYWTPADENNLVNAYGQIPLLPGP